MYIIIEMAESFNYFIIILRVVLIAITILAPLTILYISDAKTL